MPRGGHLPLRAARLFLLCVSLEVFATPTRRYHGSMLIHPSSPACATTIKRVIAHTQVRDPRESAAACFWPGLGTPSPWPPKNRESLHWHPEVSREVVEETLLILQQNQVTVSLNWSRPYKSGCFQVLISSRSFDSSICDWKINSLCLGNITLSH